MRACFCQAATRAAALIQYNTAERMEMRGSESWRESLGEGLMVASASASEKVRRDSKMLCVSVSNRLDLYAPSPSWKTQQTARGCVRFSRVCFARALLPASTLFSHYSISALSLSLCFSTSLSLFLSVSLLSPSSLFRISFLHVLFRCYRDAVTRMDPCKS